MRQLIPANLILCLTLISFTTNDNALFTCIINDKPYILHGVHAEMRVVTGGFKQLSVSNEVFTSFFFINPSAAKAIVLNSNQKREAVVRYTNPVNLNIYQPESGRVIIDVFDEQTKVLSGTFEMELIPKAGTGKKIKVTQGRLQNIPIVYK